VHVTGAILYILVSGVYGSAAPYMDFDNMKGHLNTWVSPYHPHECNWLVYSISVPSFDIQGNMKQTFILTEFPWIEPVTSTLPLVTCSMTWACHVIAHRTWADKNETHKRTLVLKWIVYSLYLTLCYGMEEDSCNFFLYMTYLMSSQLKYQHNSRNGTPLQEPPILLHAWPAAEYTCHTRSCQGESPPGRTGWYMQAERYRKIFHVGIALYGAGGTGVI